MASTTPHAATVTEDRRSPSCSDSGSMSGLRRLASAAGFIVGAASSTSPWICSKACWRVFQKSGWKFARVSFSCRITELSMRLQPPVLFLLSTPADDAADLDVARALACVFALVVARAFAGCASPCARPLTLESALTFVFAFAFDLALALASALALVLALALAAICVTCASSLNFLGSAAPSIRSSSSVLPSAAVVSPSERISAFCFQLRIWPPISRPCGSGSHICGSSAITAGGGALTATCGICSSGNSEYSFFFCAAGCCFTSSSPSAGHCCRYAASPCRPTARVSTLASASTALSVA